MDYYSKSYKPFYIYVHLGREREREREREIVKPVLHVTHILLTTYMFYDESHIGAININTEIEC